MAALSRCLASLGLLFTALMGRCSASEKQEIAELDMENEKLARVGAGKHHLFSCYEGDPWKGSCDLAEDGTIRRVADWSPDCDPWKLGSAENMTHTSGNWTCPEAYRSVSGCGDMRTDPRQLECKKTISFDWERSERIVLEAPEPLVPQKHACVQHPLFYDNYNTAGTVTPPLVGRHRERWPKWGEYEYIPPMRWLHGAEHGAIIFLYNHCLDEESVCLVRSFIRKWEARFEASAVADKKFRFIMTPMKNIMRPFAMSSWGAAYLSRGFNEWEMDRFVEEHYRHAWEDYAPDGPYDHLWVDISTRKHTCSSDTLEKARKAKQFPVEVPPSKRGTEENPDVPAASRAVRWAAVAGWISLTSVSYLFF